MERNSVGWFEIPVTDMPRAKAFYQTVLGIELFGFPLGDLEMTVFPGKNEHAGAFGALVKHAEYTPSQHGVLIYFNSLKDDLAVELSRVEAAGGTILQGKKLISPEIGHMALCIDTEGNRFALHSRN